MTYRSDVSFPEPSSWNGDQVDDFSRTKPIAYRCLTCDWTGRGGAGAFDHHVENPAHHITLRDMPHLGPLQFGHGDTQ
jgi:3',5'-cyclic AMP phosphodiesterase CpdA